MGKHKRKIGDFVENRWCKVVKNAKKSECKYNTIDEFILFCYNEPVEKSVNENVSEGAGHVGGRGASRP